MAQAPIPFQSRRPAARGKLQNFRQFLGRTIDKNEAQKARLTELKSLKSIAQAYGISRAAAESLSYDDLNAFVKRVEVERAQETMREQQAVRQAQMAQAQTSQLMALEANKRAAAARAGQMEFLDRFMPTAQDMPREFFTEAPDRFFPERRVPPPTEVGETRVLDSGSLVRGSRIVGGGGRRERRPTFNVATGEVTQATPPALERSPEDFLRRMEGLESPHAKQAAHAEFVRRQQAQQAASTAGLATQIKVNEELRKQAGERRDVRAAGRLETTLDFGTIEIDPETEKPVHRGLSLGSGNEARALTGSFSDKEEAAKARNRLGMLNDSLDKINQLQEMARKYEGASVWTGGTSVEDKQAAENLAKAIQGQIREEILGPGTVTDPERAILEQLVPSGNVFFSFLSGEDGAKELENLKNNLTSNFERYLEAWGISTGAPRGGTDLPRTGSNIHSLQVRRL